MTGNTNSDDLFYGVPSSEWGRGALTTLVATLLLVSIGVMLDKMLGDNVFAYALMYSSWIIGTAIGTRDSFLRRFSSEMKNLIVVTISSTALLTFYFVLLIAKI